MNILIIILLFILINSNLIIHLYKNKVTIVTVLIKTLIFSFCLIILNKYKVDNFVDKKHDKCVVISHSGLGDLINHIGIVRYLETKYDQVIFCLSNMTTQNTDKLKTNIDYFLDSSKIKTVIFENDNFDNTINMYKNSYDIYLGGEYLKKQSNTHTSYDIIPFSFYKDMNIPFNYFWDYSYYKKLPESIELYNKIKHIPYIIISLHTSTGEIMSITDIEKHFNINKDEILIISMDTNLYEKDHKYYNIAQEFILKPLAFYADTFINATKIILTDSAPFCFALQLPIKTDEIYYRSRNNKDYLYLWSENYGYKLSSGKKIFKKF